MKHSIRSPRCSTILLAKALFVLAACTSGDEQVAGIDGSGSPSPVAVVAQGPIQGFGSIIVNDVRYDIDAAQIRVNGELVTEAELRIGQLVTVAGQIDAAGAAGVADTVVFEANVHGPVELVDLDASILQVLGQTVAVEPATVIDLGGAAALDALAVGDRVQVSGFVDANGSIAATRLASLATAEDLRVIGTVSNLDQANLRFEIENLTVDYGQALVIEGFASGAPASGNRVLVEAAAIDDTGALVARELTLVEATLSGSEGHEAEVEGLITRFVSVADFDVAGIPITTTSETRYEGGGPTNLQVDVKVQVEGRVGAGGTIVAEKIEVKNGGRVEGSD